MSRDWMSNSRTSSSLKRGNEPRSDGTSDSRTSFQSNLQYYFVKACFHGNSLYKNIIANNKIDIHADYDCAFRKSCERGQLEVAKWLIELSQSDGFTLIDIHAQWEYVFKYSCFNGHLEVAKWLIELSQSDGFALIDIHADNDCAFILSCLSGYTKVAKWLIELSRSEGFSPISEGIINIHLKNENSSTIDILS